jgi:hypothetical protein
VLRGTLDPLRLSFASDRLIYPMRLSRLATMSQSLGLFVLAPHRMEPRGSIGGDAPEVTYAGKVAASRVLDSLTGGGATFLTALDQEFPQPRRIDGDHELRAAAADTPLPACGVRERAADRGRCARVAPDGGRRTGGACDGGAAARTDTAARACPAAAPDLRAAAGRLK